MIHLSPRFDFYSMKNNLVLLSEWFGCFWTCVSSTHSRVYFLSLSLVHTHVYTTITLIENNCCRYSLKCKKNFFLFYFPQDKCFHRRHRHPRVFENKWKKKKKGLISIISRFRYALSPLPPSPHRKKLEFSRHFKY